MISKKVVLLGNTAVGKTSIFNRVISQSYTEDGVSNTSAYFRSKIFTVEGYDQELKMNLWDTAGQERYFSLTKMYVQDAVCVVLVYDTTYADSLEGVRQWYQLVQEHLDMSRTIIALVGNKCDLQDKIEVTPQQAQHLKEVLEAQIWMEISAK